MTDLYFLVAAVGAVAGLSLGLTGLGWGAISGPLLILLGVDPQTAVGTILTTNVLASLLGSINHWHNNRSDIRLALLLGLGGVVSGVLGAFVALSLDPMALASSLSIYLALGGSAVLVVNPPRQSQYSLDARNKMKFVAAGALPGFFEGAHGSGGPAGVLTLLLLKVQAHRAVGSWLPATIIVQLLPALLYVVSSRVDWLAFMVLLAAGLPAVFIGSRLSGSLPDKILRRVIGLAVLILGLRLLIGILFA